MFFCNLQFKNIFVSIRWRNILDNSGSSANKTFTGLFCSMLAKKRWWENDQHFYIRADENSNSKWSPFWMLHVSQRASYEISLVRPSVCPSVCLSVHLSLSFLEIGSLVFFYIVHDGNWPWYLVTDRARFLKKQFGDPN